MINTNHSYGKQWVQIYNNTPIDIWNVGQFSSAIYHITIEYDSNQKETLQASVIARPDHASYTVYGRVSIQDELITISVNVDSNKLTLSATSNPNFLGARLTFTATYAETNTPLLVPTVVPTPPEDIELSGPGSLLGLNFGPITIVDNELIVSHLSTTVPSLVDGYLVITYEDF